MVSTRERTRPDDSGRPGYITVEGYRRLEDEARRLRCEKRPEVVKALSAAADEGDRSENAEYIYRKRQLGEIDRRLRFLGKRLDALTPVHEKPRDDGRVYFGCAVTVEDEDGETRRYRIVGPDEWDIARGEISMDSPIGTMLLGKRRGEKVTVQLPQGEVLLTIVAVSVDP